MDLIFVGQFVSEKESLTNINYSRAANNYQHGFFEIIDPMLTISIIQFLLMT